MAQWHLDEIENSLNKIGWTITKRLEPNEKKLFIGGWIIKRGSEKNIDFDGIFDGLGNTIKNPSLDKAYGCEIRETGTSLYFYKKGEMWREHLEKFIKDVNELK
jgi:hypothetical protein